MSRRKWSAKVSMRDSFVASENGPGGTVVGRRKRRMCLFHVLAQPQIGTAPGRYKHCAKAKQKVLACRRGTHPRSFAKRGCKLLKTKSWSGEKRGKRFQEAGS